MEEKYSLLWLYKRMVFDGKKITDQQLGYCHKKISVLLFKAIIQSYTK